MNALRTGDGRIPNRLAQAMVVTALATATADVRNLGVPATPGQHYSAKLSIKARDHARTAQLVLLHQASDGTVLQSTAGSALSTSTTAKTTLTVVNATLNASAHLAALKLLVTGANATEAHVVDLISLVQGTVPADAGNLLLADDAHFLSGFGTWFDFANAGLTYQTVAAVKLSVLATNGTTLVPITRG